MFIAIVLTSWALLPSAFAVSASKTLPRYDLLGSFTDGTLVGSFDRLGYRTHKEILFAWSNSGSSNHADPMAYDYVLKAEVPYGGVVDRDRPDSDKPRDCASDYFTSVKTTCVKGNCGMPSRMYIGKHNGEVCASFCVNG